MAYVRKIDPKDADGILRRVFNARMKAAGRLWEIVAVQSLNAESLRDCMRVYGQIMYGDSHLTREEREMIAVVTSQVNECHYWIKAHLYDLRSEVDDQDVVTRFAINWREAGLEERFVALLEYCVRLTTSPKDCSESDVILLRGHGYSDEAISDCVQVCGFFNYINRIADGLGVDDEPWLDDLGLPIAATDMPAGAE
jgi:uncharacterized peroxidase-related enzyme